MHIDTYAYIPRSSYAPPRTLAGIPSMESARPLVASVQLGALATPHHAHSSPLSTHRSEAQRGHTYQRTCGRPRWSWVRPYSLRSGAEPTSLLKIWARKQTASMMRMLPPMS